MDWAGSEFTLSIDGQIGELLGFMSQPEFIRQMMSLLRLESNPLNK